MAPDNSCAARDTRCTKVVGLGGFEPPTSPLSGVRSNQLSYRPMVGTPSETVFASTIDQVTCVGTHAEELAWLWP